MYFSIQCWHSQIDEIRRWNANHPHTKHKRTANNHLPWPNADKQTSVLTHFFYERYKQGGDCWRPHVKAMNEASISTHWQLSESGLSFTLLWTHWTFQKRWPPSVELTFAAFDTLQKPKFRFYCLTKCLKSFKCIRAGCLGVIINNLWVCWETTEA